MMVLLAITATALAVYDTWVVLSGNLNLGRYIPGLPSLDCVLWMVGVRAAHRRGLLEPRRG